MIRILHCVNNMHRAGLETMIMNYYRSVDRSQIQFDFLTHRPFRSDYDDEIEAMGGKVYYAPRLTPQNYPAYFSFMKKFYKEHPEYKIVHSHIDAMSYLPLLAAKKAGVPIRIAHSHNTQIDKDYKYVLKQMFRHRIGKVSTHQLACGKEAGEFLFKQDHVLVIPNAVQADEFLFHEVTRTLKRKELGVEGKFVVGHIGRFTAQKNHGFLIEIFNELQKIKPESILLLIGTGEDEEKIKTKVFELGLSQKVHFLGVRADVAQLYQAFDLFLLPSLYEGLPVVGVEAQFADLPCVFSHTVTNEVAFSDKCYFVDLNCSAEEWAKAIVQLPNQKRMANRYENSCYRIENATGILERYYHQLLEAEGIDEE